MLDLKINFKAFINKTFQRNKKKIKKSFARLKLLYIFAARKGNNVLKLLIP